MHPFPNSLTIRIYLDDPTRLGFCEEEVPVFQLLPLPTKTRVERIGLFFRKSDLRPSILWPNGYDATPS